MSTYADAMLKTLGPERYAEFVRRSKLNAICYSCPHRETDGDSLQPCEPPNNYDCPRKEAR